MSISDEKPNKISIIKRPIITKEEYFNIKSQENVYSTTTTSWELKIQWVLNESEEN